MPRIVLAALVAAALATPAAADQVLYVTAAVPNRVEGFCLGPNGGIALRPVFQQDTVENPRRLLIPDKPDGSPGDVLYVAGKHKVESFLIKTNGGLERIGVTADLHNANPFDLAVNAARTHLYVPHRAAGRIEAYPLDPVTGAILGGDMTSCARLPSDVNLQDLETSDLPGFEVLYATASTAFFSGGKRGRIDVFQLTNGELPDLYDENVDPEGAFRCGNPDATTTSTTTSTSSTSLTTLTTTVTTTSTSTTIDTRITQPLSTRKKLRGPGPFVLAGEFLYVYDVITRRIIEFQLSGGLFTDEKQPRVAASDEVGRLLDLIMIEEPGARTLLGAADNLGRVRAFALKDDGGFPTRVPKRPKRDTQKVIGSSPVRIRTATSQTGELVLYIPGGEINQIFAHHIRGRLLPIPDAFSKTEKRTATFPNDAAVAEIAGTCP